MDNGETALAPKARDYSVAALERGLDLLEALARLGPSSLTALTALTGCTPSGGFRLLRTLQKRGFVLQDGPRGAWRLAARADVLGRAASAQGTLARAARPFLATLSKACGENTYLIIRDGMRSLLVATHQVDPKLRLVAEAGRRQPLHAGAGRLLLAYAPLDLQTQFLTERLARLTPQTRTEPLWIAADLPRIRARGHLITVEEVTPGGVSIAVPVRDGAGAIAAALVVAAPSLRLSLARARKILPLLLEHAEALGRILGHAPPHLACDGKAP